MEVESMRDEREEDKYGGKGTLRYKERKRWALFGLPFTFTVYRFYDNDLQITSGLLNVREQDCYMYRISDISLSRTLFQRIFGLGTITCYTSDVTNKTLVIKNIKHSQKIKDFIYKASEECKLRRRTINMQNIGAHLEDADMDDLLDS